MLKIHLPWRRWQLAGASLLLPLVGCTDQYLTVAESDVVITFKDEGRDYGAYRTYLAPTSVVDLCPTEDGEGEGGAGGASSPVQDCEPADHSLDDEVLEALHRNMQARGYREITDPDAETPDLALFVGIIARDNWFVSTSPGYCYPYSYFYYGCWYPGYSYAYNLPTNAYVIDLADVDESQDSELSSAWTAFLQGIDQASAEKSGAKRVNDAVDKAFQQSPYLKAGGAQ